MGLFDVLGNFLFGKSPDIFDENGRVLHKHPKKKWDAWQNKFKIDPQYNWRNHTGTTAGRNPSAGQKQNPNENRS